LFPPHGEGEGGAIIREGIDAFELPGQNLGPEGGRLSFSAVLEKREGCWEKKIGQTDSACEKRKSSWQKNTVPFLPCGGGKPRKSLIF